MNLERLSQGDAVVRRAVSWTALVAFLGLAPALAGTAGATLVADTTTAVPELDSSFVQTVANGGGAFEQPLGVAFDTAADEIVVANTGAGRIEYFGRDGVPHGYFVHRVTTAAGEDRDGLPRHVAIDSKGRLLVVDALAGYIDICDFRGHSLGHITLPAPDDDISTGFGPGPITVAGDGRIIVASRNKAGGIHILAADGTPLAAWGTAGTAGGQLRAITGVAVAPNGEIAVSCVLTELGVQVFDATGRYLRGFGPHDIGPGCFSIPNGIVVTPDSRYWVADMMRHNVQVFDPTGKLLGVLGGGDGPGAMLYPSALASDGRGMFATVETGGKLLRLMWVR